MGRFSPERAWQIRQDERRDRWVVGSKWWWSVPGWPGRKPLTRFAAGDASNRRHQRYRSTYVDGDLTSKRGKDPECGRWSIRGLGRITGNTAPSAYVITAPPARFFYTALVVHNQRPGRAPQMGSDQPPDDPG